MRSYRVRPFRVIGYYGDQAAIDRRFTKRGAPKPEPGSMAVQVDGDSLGALSADIAVLRARDDIGDVIVMGPDGLVTAP